MKFAYGAFKWHLVIVYLYLFDSRKEVNAFIKSHLEPERIEIKFIYIEKYLQRALNYFNNSLY